jgi:hypothetical protein
MQILSRALVGLIGLLSLLSVGTHWFRVESLVAERGLSAVGDIGRANIRADIGGMFLAIGLFCLFAAARANKAALLAAIALVGAALLGRFVSVAIDGGSARVYSPMIIEGVVIAILMLALWSWKKVPEGL